MEDDAVSNCPADHTNDKDAGGCCKTVVKKRRARKMNTHKKTQPSESISGISQRNLCKQSANQHLPSLLIHDKKIILRPHGELCLQRWTRPEIAGALWSAARLTTKDREDIVFRLRPLKSLVIIRMPLSHVADALYRGGSGDLVSVFIPSPHTLWLPTTLARILFLVSCPAGRLPR
ncbi:hypothetical protein MRX96_031725 [Rhipicephalus microplus]